MTTVENDENNLYRLSNRESGDFKNLQDSLHANQHALSSGQVKPDSDKGKL